MSNITICMEEHSEFLATEAGQAFLEELATRGDEDVVRQIANSELTTPKVLSQIVERFAVHERNCWTYDAALNMIRCVARNHAMDESGMDNICAIVIDELKQNHADFLYDILIGLLKDVAANPNTGDDALRKILDSQFTETWKMQTNDGRTDEVVINVIQNTENKDILSEAAKQLAQRYKVFLATKRKKA